MEDRILSLTEGAATVAHSGAANTSAPTHPGSDALRDVILTVLDENKAEEVVQIDLRGKTAMADHMVIASGRSSRQVAATAEKLADTLKQDFRVATKIEGKDAGDWVLIDAGDVIVHLFRPEVREFYQLEKMWMDPGTVPPPSASPTAS